jgi:hypothetical protein
MGNTVYAKQVSLFCALARRWTEDGHPGMVALRCGFEYCNQMYLELKHGRLSSLTKVRAPDKGLDSFHRPCPCVCLGTFDRLSTFDRLGTFDRLDTWRTWFSLEFRLLSSIKRS